DRDVLGRRADALATGGLGTHERPGGLLREPGERPSAGGGHGARAARHDECARAAVRTRIAPDHAVTRRAVMALRRSDVTRLGFHARLVLIAVVILAVAVAAPVAAQAPGQVPVLDGIAA